MSIKRSSQVIGAALFALGIGGFPFTDTVFGGTFIVKDGQPQAEIIIAETPARMTKLAASNLQEYVCKMTGATLPVTNAPSGNIPVKIYVGKSTYTDNLKLSTDGLAHGAFRMASGNDWLALLGPDKDFTPLEPWARNRDDIPRARKEWDALNPGEYYGFPYRLYLSRSRTWGSDLDLWAQDDGGTMNAVCEFLRSLGVRWYFPGELGDVVPKIENIVLPEVDKTVKPDFALRNFEYFSQDKDTILWNARMGINVGHELLGVIQPSHGSQWVYAREEVRKAHPDWYSVWNGERSHMPCLSSEGLLKQHLKFARMMFDARRQPMLSLGPLDGYGRGLCQCELWKGKGTLERGWEGTMSDYVWDYINRVAVDLYKTHPDRKVSGGAYGAYLLPPEKIAMFSPNQVVSIAQHRCQFDDRATRKRILKLRQDWLAKLPSKQLFLYDFYLHNRPQRQPDIPVYFPRLIAEDLRSLKGVTLGEWVIVYHHAKDKFPWHALATAHLNMYVTTRLWWNVSQDLDALLDEYYRLFYGPAEKEMKAFVEYSETNWPFMTRKTEPIDKALDLLTTAQNKAGGTIYGKRIDMVVECLKPLKERREKLAVYRKDAPKAFAVERKSGDLKLDGKLDEPFWKDVPVYELKERVSGYPPVSKTTVQMVWIHRAIVFGVRCDDADMDHLSMSGKQNDDPNIFGDDNVGLFLETQAHEYYQMAINAAGFLVDLDRKDGKKNTLWDSEAEVMTHKGPDAWTLEIHIPTADLIDGGIDSSKRLDGTKPLATAPWYFNVNRYRVRGKARESSVLFPIGTSRLDAPSTFGELLLKE